MYIICPLFMREEHLPMVFTCPIGFKATFYFCLTNPSVYPAPSIFVVYITEELWGRTDVEKTFSLKAQVKIRSQINSGRIEM